MSDLIKAQNTPQFNWYTRWMSLGTDGTPDKLIKEGLKQPDWIKIFFKKNFKDLNSKEITGQVAPNQALFGAEYFLAYTLPNFKLKILTWLLDAQKADGPLLFNLMGQCFPGIGLTEWTSVTVKQCPNNADCTKANFDKCIRDYLGAVAGFPNIDNQLICWLRTSKKLALMPMHEFIWCRVQLLSYLDSGYLRQMMEVPTAQEKSEQIFFVQPKVHQNKFADLNKMVPTDPLKMIAFFEQCQATNKAAGILEKIAKDKQPKERKTAELPVPRSCESSYCQHCSHKYCNYHQSGQRDRDDWQSNYRHQDDWHHDCPQCNDKDMRSNKSYDKKDDCKCDHFKKKSDEAMHNDQSSSDGNLSERRSWSCSRSPLQSCSCFRSCSCSISRSYINHHVDQDNRKPSAAPKQGYHPSMGTCIPPRVTMADAFITQTKTILCLPPSLLQKQRRSTPRNRELRQ
jgi:hypothetical protein